jgi:hypothetical protein
MLDDQQRYTLSTYQPKTLELDQLRQDERFDRPANFHTKVKSRILAENVLRLADAKRIIKYY